MTTGNYSNAISGIAVLVVVIVVFHIFVWSPLNAWSVRFIYDTSDGIPAPVHGRSRLRFYMARSAFLLALWKRGVRPLIRSIVGVLSLILERERTWRGSALAWILLVGFGGAVSYGVLNSLVVLMQPSPFLREIPIALMLSFLRIVVAYLLALAWTLPLAVWIGRNADISRRVMPVLEVVASIPATAFFPLIVLVIVRWGGDMNLASILLVTTGMCWYLLFNLIAGVRAIPDEMHQISQSLGLRGGTRWKRLILPAIYPSLVTGSLTAIGGGWNALVLSEYVTAEGRIYKVRGIGALLDAATYESGDLQLIVMSISAMVLFILIVNRFVWQPAYELAQKRFALNY